MFGKGGGLLPHCVTSLGNVAWMCGAPPPHPRPRAAALRERAKGMSICWERSAHMPRVHIGCLWFLHMVYKGYWKYPSVMVQSMARHDEITGCTQQHLFGVVGQGPAGG